MKKGKLTALFLSTAIGLNAITGCDHVDTPEQLTGDAKTIDNVCKSKAPVLVVDFFSASFPEHGTRVLTHTIDIDGDGTDDIDHGDLVAKIYNLNGQNVIRYGLPYGSDSSGLFDNSVLIDALLNILSSIKDKKIAKPSSVSLSIQLPASIADLHRRLGADLQLTPQNIHGKKDQIIERVLREKDNKTGNPYYEHISKLYDIYVILDTLKAMGIPVITAAGNDYSAQKVNMFSILGATSIGALTHDGSERAPYSNQNSLTQIYRTGDFISRKIDGGIDINNDGRVDFPDGELSKGTTIVSKINGKSVRHFVFEIDGYPNFDIFRTMAYHERWQKYDAKTRESIARIYGPYINTTYMIELRENAAGNLLFDPANDGTTNQVAIRSGTSYAVPNICS